MRRVLNVGGNRKEIPLPPQYAGWEHVLLDIDPQGKPDVVCDARKLSSLPGSTYDSVYCSHNLEHYYHHDVTKVLTGFIHVLKADGFAFIIVPDLGELMRNVVEKNLDIDDVAYHTKAGLHITVRDVIYGYGVQIEKSGNHFYGHKTGFTEKSLQLALSAAGFPWVFTRVGNLEVSAIAFTNKPTEYAARMFNLSDYNYSAAQATSSASRLINKTELTRQYLDLLKKSLLNELYVENEARLVHTFSCMLNNRPLEYSQYFNITRDQSSLVNSLLDCKLTGSTLVLTHSAADGGARPATELRNITELSHTMIGRKRLENVQYCVETVLAENIKGDLIETGIWRGGACIFMQGILKAYGATDRNIWAADSFEGVPPPTWLEDEGFDISARVLPVLAVSLDEVKELFSRYGLLDENVKFLKGWFKDTLKSAPIEQLAILRLDGDLYESTMDALISLYDKVTPGGFVIVDDYGSCPPCKRAIDDFRSQRGIADTLHIIDVQSVYWRKGSATAQQTSQMILGRTAPQPAAPASMQTLQQAIDYHKAGRLQEAERIYRAILQAQPNHPDAAHNLGVLAVQVKQPASGLPHFRTALEANPANRQYWLSYIDALIITGQTGEARQALEHARKCGLGGMETDALAARLENPSQSEPDEQEIKTLVTLFADGRFAEAETFAHMMTLRFPLYGVGWKALGIASEKSGRDSDALASMQKAAALLPGDAESHFNLATLLHKLDRLDEAVASYRQALKIKPDYAEAHRNLGLALQNLGRLVEAAASYRLALETRPDFAEAHNSLGVTLQDLGLLEEALASYRRALEINPNHTVAYSNLLFLLNHIPDLAGPVALEQARQYGRIVSNNAKTRFMEWSCTKRPERLRIGFVSGDFIHSPVGHFLEPLLSKLNPASIEIIAYPTSPKADKFTSKIKSYFSAWRPLFGLSDEEAARLIHADSVHVLIDLSGHTKNNLLPVFAWKPAPVQVSWLGYFATTGVAEIDYLIADPWTLPNTEEIYFTEKIWRLPETRLCFRPPDEDVAVSPLPALANGYITFGCFNNLTKMNDKVVALWSRVLAAVPNSRLFLKAQQLGEPSVQQHTIERFAGHGIDAWRLILEGFDSHAKYLTSYHMVDIALDTFPYPGGTTSFDALWMGVPVLTLNGERFLSRQGVGILMNAGLPDWIAADATDYMGRALTHAGDLQNLINLRSRLRRQVLASPLFDATRFARHFETAIWEMWQEYRHRQT